MQVAQPYKIAFWECVLILIYLSQGLWYSYPTIFFVIISGAYPPQYYPPQGINTRTLGTIFIVTISGTYPQQFFPRPPPPPTHTHTWGISTHTLLFSLLLFQGLPTVILYFPYPHPPSRASMLVPFYFHCYNFRGLPTAILPSPGPVLPVPRPSTAARPAQCSTTGYVRPARDHRDDHDHHRREPSTGPPHLCHPRHHMLLLANRNLRHHQVLRMPQRRQQGRLPVCDGVLQEGEKSRQLGAGYRNRLRRGFHHLDCPCLCLVPDTTLDNPVAQGLQLR